MNQTSEPGAAPAADVVTSSLDQGVLLVSLNRPERLNAMTPAMERRYAEIVLAAADDPAVKVIVITGTGRAFCAGADMGSLDDMASGKGRPEKLRRHRFLTEIPKPVIAAVNGACMGAGFSLAMMCDLRFAGMATKIGAGTARLGLPAEYGTDWMLAHTVGVARAFEILASGRLFSGAEAERLGLVNRVLPDADLLSETLRFATELATQCAPRSLAMIKRQIYQSVEASLAAADDTGERQIVRSIAAPDFAEALAARREKRPARFPDLGAESDWWAE